MFEHLDDPDDFRANESFRLAVEARARRHRARRRVAAGSVGAFVALAALGLGVAIGGRTHAQRPQRLQVTNHDDQAVGAATNLLLVGTTGRGADAIRASVAAVRVDPVHHTVTVLAIPLSFEVTAARRTHSLSDLSPQDLVDALVALGIPVDHYVEHSERTGACPARATWLTEPVDTLIVDARLTPSALAALQTTVSAVGPQGTRYLTLPTAPAGGGHRVLATGWQNMVRAIGGDPSRATAGSRPTPEAQPVDLCDTTG
jgi:hypothetical protein